MNIVNFEPCHAAEAALIALEQMKRELAYVDMPEMNVPDLACFANGLGVAALEEGHVVGYLCAGGPFKGMFGTWGTEYADRMIGVYSPVEAHGIAAGQPERLWQLMYQAAAEKWARAGAVYHALTLFEHDGPGKHALFRYGFGQRCADAVRRVTPIASREVEAISVCELPTGSAEKVRELRIMLDQHLEASPTFMLRNNEARKAWLEAVKHRDSRLFVALEGDETVAFIEVCREGENYLTCHTDMLNICGACCKPEWRGKGVSRLLLDYILRTLQAEGVRWLGVDYESMNPTALGFWEKYFSPYTASLVRRIDG